MRTSTPGHRLPARFLAVSAALAACIGLWAPAAHAVTYVEVGDAGESLGTAQAVGAADTIRGSLLISSVNDRADIFSVFLTAGQTFTATTTLSSITYNNFDTTLFLFGGTGLGLVANDDDSGPQSTISGFTPSASGIYYLAIAGAGYNPVSAGGLIFPVLSGGGQFGPTGAGGGQSLSGWNSTTREGDLYEIRLTGVTAVPEPASALAMLAGLMACSVPLARRRSARQFA